MSRLGSWFLTIFLLVVTGLGAYCQSELEAPVTYPLSQEARTVAVADLSGDGRDDVAVTTWPSGLFVFYQQDGGFLGPAVEFYAPTLPFALAIGDLNGDLRKDLAVGGADGVILIYCQASDGTFSSPTACASYGLVNSLVIDDLNGDGLADIANTCADYPVVLISFQTSDGTFGLPTVFQVSGYNARGICTLDYNSDGRRDIALLLDDQVCCLTGASGGSFEAPEYITATWAFALAAGDVTGDGRDDLIFTVPTNQPDAAVGVISQGSNGLPGSPKLYPAYDYAQALALVDLDEDGRNDVLTAHAGYEAVTALYQNADGTLGEWNTYSAPYCNGYEPAGLAAGDLNSDGHPDLALADWWNGLVVFLHTPGAPIPQQDTTAPVCTANISGALGTNGWYTSPVTVTLAAEDNAGGSGLADILFTFDGSIWSSYMEPLVVSTQGATSIGYFAQDKASNSSSVQWISIKLDMLPPVLAVEPLIKTIWPPNGAVVDVPVNVMATDVTSGITKLHLEVIDEYGLVQPAVDVIAGATPKIPLVASRNDDDPDGRVYTLILTGTDAAGNIAVVASTVSVPRSNPAKPDKPKKTK